MFSFLLPLATAIIVPSPRQLSSALLADMGTRVELVVAVYDEDLSWLSDVPGLAGRSHLYVKGGPEQLARCASAGALSLSALPNVGREGHTYLTHILARYDDLPDVTLFTQGDPLPHGPAGMPTMREFVLTARRALLHLNVSSGYESVRNLAPVDCECASWGHVDLSHPRYDFRRHVFGPSEVGSLADFWAAALPEWPRPDGPLIHHHFAMFAATRAAIRRNPRSVYARLLALLPQTVDPEEGHYLERMWRVILEGGPERVHAAAVKGARILGRVASRESPFVETNSQRGGK